MSGQSIVCFLTFVCLQLSAFGDDLTYSHNIFCQPLPQIVPVHVKGKFQGSPYFVKLDQCQGSVKPFSPEVKQCVVKTWTPVKVTVDNKHVISMDNHTSCKEVCVKNADHPEDLFQQDKSTCAFTCKHNIAPEGHECSKDYSWHRTDCKCQCNLKAGNSPSKKLILNPTACKFVCKAKERKCRSGRTWDLVVCRCVKSPNTAAVDSQENDNSHQGTLLAAVVVGEFVFLYLIFDFLLYSKKTGLMYYVSRKFRSKKPNEAPSQENGHETRPLQNVRIDIDGRSHVEAPPSQLVTST